MKKIFILLFAALAAAVTEAQTIDLSELKDWIPEIHGTIRGKYEWQTTNNTNRFQVRSARVNITGAIVPSIVTYKAEIDLCDQGSMKMLDAYARITPVKGLDFTIGQMRVPFTIDAHRSPHLQYFANRSFIAKQMGSLRDAGATVRYSYKGSCPFSFEAGLFNGSGTTSQKEWHHAMSFSGKLILQPVKEYNLTLSMQRIRPNDKDIYMYDIGTWYEKKGLHLEVEAMLKNYAHSDYDNTYAVDAFVSYRINVNKKKSLIKSVSLLSRYDYMGNNCDGSVDDDDLFYTTDYKRHRYTGGVTISFGGPNQADLRINYEKYWYDSLSLADESEQDKLVIELMVHF